MIDGRAATSPAGVALERGMRAAPPSPFSRWAAAARSAGGAAWMQINHPGRQVRADQGGVALAPSAIGMERGGFAAPGALTADEISEIVRRFARTAALAIDAGFTGVEIHAAHGYLLNQFLSPLANHRTDGYGGDLAGRSRLLMEVVDAVRSAVPSGASVGLKLNTADFQRGGFDEDDAEAVVLALEGRGIDLLELSGGTAASPAMHGARAVGMPQSSRDRQAFFLDLSRRLVAAAKMPTMLTGGIDSLATALDVRASGVDVVGMGTALVVVPDLPARWRDGVDPGAVVPELDVPAESLSASAQAVVRWTLRRWAALDPDGDPAAPSPVFPAPRIALAAEASRRRRLLPRYGAYVAARSGEPRV
jgi:2,4-dienoyl-CoA reductase-like NADH-dependent reductase (Old Yellow Enzyme family)